MAERGAQEGNQNAAKSKRLFTAALKRVLTQNPERVEAIALSLISSAEAGEQWAIKELIDRVDGKAVQPVVGGDDDDNPISIKEILIRGVDAADNRPSSEGT